MENNMKKCPYCKKEIYKGAKICPYCNKDLRNWFNRHPIITIILAIIFFSSISSFFSDAENINNTNSTNIINNTPNLKDKENTWTYSESKDEMDGTITKYAHLTSDNTINLDFPYSGKQHGRFTIRKKGYKTDVMFMVDKGQIQDYGVYARLKFDNENPIKVSITGTSDGTSNIVFLGSANLILKKLSYAKKLKLEVEFFQNGRQIFDFNVKGFNKNFKK